MFDKLNEKLAKDNCHGELCIVGGAAMILHFNNRMATKDIDGIFKPTKQFRQYIFDIADELEINHDWLNDGAKGFMGKISDVLDVYNGSNLKVYSPSLDYLFAMKCISARADSYDKQDVETLVKALNIGSIEEAILIIEKHYDRAKVLPKTKYFLDEIISNMKK
ncbi:MAG: hypothetical protein A2504_07205 [Bdellovibrionales bacterium RIFOXYD12_FULL_39_22]|nr:MAG: hypothetical protein A2385_05420 [Bdellovibrionales bacterium RIFOXYB1_FULL_39_21]OFZ44358.1 MAG: hypothetical protein A2485_16200 [Bdellovibrionales bacterium RIFOXYC12_FULL_39_17]OFZ49219.1 MAG: hypothetical protein A2404_16140 [Bdellovibrionales bacterium RIFOXYC1_FULL_39_130]OFZ77027.1 MAG: hypothetical protein A2560_11225 [Bdellovibrionales bacterium RIFOXYD1_FULL_39_84]OFZ95234.1 MAG: hypothetical protein A2504_07205 [Bdellovibrionales bacterium RIFOXYD12_FULL_39_22]